MAYAVSKADQWRIAKSTHFLVHYKSAEDDFIKKVIDTSEDYYNKIADELGFRRFDFWLWERRAKIYIWDNALDYQSGTGQPGWSSGCALAKEKIIQTFPYDEDFFETILPHELGHIVFREFVGFDNPAIPAWLDEGIASYQEKVRYVDVDKLLSQNIKKNIFIGLEDLTGSNPYLTNDTFNVQLFYAQAVSIVNFLIKEFGRDKFVVFCQNLRDKKNLEASLASAYPFKTLKDLDLRWQEYLRK